MKITVPKPAISPTDGLRSYADAPYPILSLYIGWSKKSPRTSELISRARSQFTTHLKPYEQQVFHTDFKKIVDYLRNSFDPRGQNGVAFFAAREHLWRVLALPFTPPDLCLVSHSPYLQPFESLQAQQGRYAVMLFDREKAEYLLAEAGRIKRLDFFEETTVPARSKTKKEWLGRDDKKSRQTKGRMRHHLQAIVRRLKDFLKLSQIHRLIIGGHQEAFSELESLLDHRVAREIVAEVPVDLKEDLNQVIRKCLEAVR